MSAYSITGRRVELRPLSPADWEAWREVRKRCRDWLLKWEPRSAPGHPDPTEDRRAFLARCGARERERELGSGYGFGVFVGGRFGGEINLNSIQRGPFQNAYIGYWMDEAMAGNGYTPEAVAVLFQFAFEELGLHRVQISIIPRNSASRRVVEKLRVRDEGVAERYLEINGTWEDHIRYAITAEEWRVRRDEFRRDWIVAPPQ
ncbi:MAG: [ribosomal protein S5]-alanine N-acetyltransferase [Actinomycetota bacterium]|jgi:ribosomal-protein-alanine N-acetyltransferase|nr:[ribosomal protein S5]-alanine N-acetyltransferase [Actinomycetota bacterium]